MAFRNKEITNPVTGQMIKFLQTTKDTNGALLEMISTYRSFSQEPPIHYHPYQAEDFRVTEGELTVRINGEKKILQAGDSLHVAPNVAHTMWNGSRKKAVVHWKVYPARDTEYLLETTIGLACDGKTNETGMPGFLQIALLMSRFSDVFRLKKPPYIIQKIIFTMARPIGYLLGYRSTYRHHID